MDRGPDGEHNLAILLLEDPPAFYKAVYNNDSSQSLDDVACSNLITEYLAFADVPAFPTVISAVVPTLLWLGKLRRVTRAGKLGRKYRSVD
jgi:hypothetical protein